MTEQRSVFSSVVLLVTLFAFMALTITPVQAGIIDQVGQYADVLPKEIFQPFKPDEAPEIYGPTPINAQLGNQGLSVGVRKNGTISTLSWPRQSMWDQVKFHTASRSQENWGAAKNAGLFLGVSYVNRDGNQCVGGFWSFGHCIGGTEKPKYENKGGSLLRNWTFEGQSYTNSLNDVIKTVYTNDAVNLKIVVKDLVPLNENVTAGESGDLGSYADNNYLSDGEALPGDALIRRVNVIKTGDFPYDKVRVFSYSNFNMVKKHHPYVPTADWAEQITDMEDAYWVNADGGLDALYHFNQDRNNYEHVIASAFGKESELYTDVQVGYDNIQCTSASFDCMANFIISGTADMVQQGANGAYKYFKENETLDSKWTNNGNHCPTADVLFGIGWCPTMRGFFSSTGMLSKPIEPGTQYSPGRMHVIFAASRAFDDDDEAKTNEDVQDIIRDARDLAKNNWDDAVDAKEEWYRSLLGGAPVPDAPNDRIEELSKRSLVTIVQDYDPRSGAIVASIARQSPYAEDWPRDGAYFNYVLDHKLGLHDWVEKRNHWYAEIQQKKDGFHLEQFLVPAGNWAMNYYGNGKVGGVIPWEVDETGYMVWAFWDHYRATKDRQYLEEIYPALKRSADFLEQFEDESTGLQKKAHEDDHFTKSQTLVGANTTWLAMRSAEKAAEVLGKTDDAEKYRKRKQELGVAIDNNLWNAEREAWGIKHWAQAEIAWPTRFTSWSNDRMQSHLQSSWNKISATFEQPTEGDNKTGGESGITNSEGIVMGLYETKFLIPMAKAAKANNNTQQLNRVKDGLNWIADKWATKDTLIMGEVWMKCGEPETAHPCDDPNSIHDDEDQIVSTVSQPHAWEQALFYLGAQEAYPTDEIDGTDSGGYYGGYPGFGY